MTTSRWAKSLRSQGSALASSAWAQSPGSETAEDIQTVIDFNTHSMELRGDHIEDEINGARRPLQARVITR